MRIAAWEIRMKFASKRMRALASPYSYANMIDCWLRAWRPRPQYECRNSIENKIGSDEGTETNAKTDKERETEPAKNCEAILVRKVQI